MDTPQINKDEHEKDIMKNISDFQILEVIDQNRVHKIVSAIEKGKDQENDAQFTKKVVLKYTQSSNDKIRMLERAQNELSVLQSINSKYVVKGNEVFEDDGVVVLSLEAIEGISIKKAIATEFRFNVETFLKTAIEIARGISDLHQSKILHLDVNPNNLIFNPKDLSQPCKIIDFESSGRYSTLGLDDKDEHSQELFGTFAYISPEQTGRTRHKIDSRSDLYSFGVTLYEMITGDVPFSS
ncbi:MAG: protein kinase, partial [Bdellovibrionia bacterium]